ncbi:MAG: DUF1801 domain-containing protein [Flavipsychrobacter sp.]|nr:DUF1801 domain-containing protein [Flavipsychrobacter sp.]
MAEIKTKETDISPEKYILSSVEGQKKEDALQLLELMKKWTREEPRMWGPSIIGYGKYTYTYDSGHSGEMCASGFSPRKNALTLYVLTGDEDEALMAQLGKYTRSKACLYVKKLADIHLPTLEKLVKASLKKTKAAEKEMAAKASARKKA